jgi:hypothetical protein
MGGTRSAHELCKKCIQSSGWKSWREEIFYDLDIGVGIKYKYA